MVYSGKRQIWFWVAQSLTIARVALVFSFVVIAPFAHLWPITTAIYCCAWLTDVFDGRVARAKQVVTHFGGAMDIFGDRYFLVISCVYVGFRGVSLVPLAIIVARELYSVALRMVQINGEGIMLHNRTLGGIVHILVALGTVGFIASPRHDPLIWFFVPFYAIASLYLFYFPYSIYKSRKRIWNSIISDLDKAS